MQRTKRLRETLQRVFSSIAAHREPADKDLSDLLEAHARAVAAAKLVRIGGAFNLVWTVENDTDTLLHAVANDAVRLLGDVSLQRVKMCPNCGWLFVDASRNGSRRWCSMDTCGARDKMRRYYQRSRSEPTA